MLIMVLLVNLLLSIIILMYNITAFWKIIFVGAFVLISACVTNDKQKKADEYARQAIALIDEQQKYDDAIGLLEKALRLVPKNLIYQYELAYVYYAKKEFAKTIKYLKKNKS